MNIANETRERIFVENTWYAAAWEWEVTEADNKLARTICEVPLVIYRKEDGGYAALDNRCCHRGAPLALGRIEGNCLRCLYHGLLFNDQGEVIQIPGQDTVASSFRVRSYAIAAKGGMIWVWMGDAAQANEADIHDFAPLSDSQWRGFDRGDYLHYDANWLLIVDNLSDFSHVAFVHANTLGGSEAYAYDTRIEGLNKLDNGFEVDRWHRNAGPPPFHQKIIPSSEHGVNLDRLNRMAMYLPGVFLMETHFSPVGENAAQGSHRQYRNCQFMTPETRNSTHFFWDYLHEAKYSDQPGIAASLKESLLEGFMEDKIYIEAQQKLLEQSPDFVPRSFSADEAFQHFRNLWRQRLKEEDETHPLTIAPNPRRIL